MPVLWRLYEERFGPGLDGAGGMFAEGRWHSLGERVVYFGASAAIVVVERLARTDPDILPRGLQLGRFECSDAVAHTRVEEISPLPDAWVDAEDLTRRIGGQWRASQASCFLSVPSAILPEESNVVFNPLHLDAEHLRLVDWRPFRFGARLI